MSNSSVRRLDPRDSYPCPICHRGETQAMPLMEDAFACSFCQHIFTADLDRQILKLADSQVPLSWYWHGRGWRGVRHGGSEMSWSYAIAALVFVGLPPTIVGTAAYLFPSDPSSALAWLPVVWTILTLVLHAACMVWLMMEYYQFPIVAHLRAVLRQSPGRRSWQL
ncbi:hypothetical protein KR51_00023090 [Rubidibacter lacunae KORDI 51-2]|uniref:Uncharacterized protein n=1 Tax=Rubidibacter lacunae KORDI 51-2 TaxID=582515 RepID=U5DJF1_9CHRO|nr:hypothetical protein [Rubidibacter lacunae]ERN41052.1 hypothetical protein KR51_00023090 [Rubidibacter lacunae KORDI 51-2]